ncbi:MAG: AGE family epimerase/isomerase [Balneolaceae bacterium]
MKLSLAAEIDSSLQYELLDPWYPKAVDEVYGGFFSSFTHDFTIGENQDKMIVTQARHVWVNSKAAEKYPDSSYFESGAEQGFQFLQNKMWDEQYGGFYTMVDREGNVPVGNSIQKTSYGNAFAIYGLAAYYNLTGDEAALDLAKETFRWLEENSHDPEYLGYFQHLERDGTPIPRPENAPSTSDIGYKDQNSSIHLLEAFSELYQVWPDELVRERLEEMLYLIRDTIRDERGFLVLFFQPDWTPVSFQDSSREVIMRHRFLDHVSFGHDVETAFLMMEASHILGLENDTTTLQAAKGMVDHALNYGWDKINGGLYDEGYYLEEDEGLTIIANTKNWWAQAEALNSLLLMTQHFPEDEMNYFAKFQKQWDYVKRYLIDHENGGWYEQGIDKQAEYKTRPKGHIWKGTYHNYRGMANSVQMLREGKIVEI